MLLLKTDSSLSNPNLPLFQASANERTLADLAPSLWLEGDDRYLQKTSGNVFAAWIDRASGRRYIPETADRPQMINFGTKKALRFGYMANNAASTISGANNGSLIPEGGWGSMSLSGTYTLALLLRLPKDKGQPGSELIAPTDVWSGGAILATGANPGTPFVYGDNTPGVGGIGIFHPGQNLFGFTGTFHDANWHAVVVSSNAVDDTSTFRIDGSQAAANVTQPINPFPNATGGTQLLIGRVNGEGLGNLVGDIGAVIYIPDFAAHTVPASLAAVEGHLLDLKASMA